MTRTGSWGASNLDRVPGTGPHFVGGEPKPTVKDYLGRAVRSYWAVAYTAITQFHFRFCKPGFYFVVVPVQHQPYFISHGSRPKRPPSWYLHQVPGTGPYFVGGDPKPTGRNHLGPGGAQLLGSILYNYNIISFSLLRTWGVLCGWLLKNTNFPLSAMVADQSGHPVSKGAQVAHKPTG